ncbi:hypothetical protein BRC78_07510 [Halobacteriales archaeon QH_8_68_33]|nr:MAG: hypothetical protein BRC78_07510 [Halobacteriales archaeon QH_8_68_33]
MEMPRRFNTYCPHCNEHNEHEVEKVRGGRSSGMTKVDLRYRCAECGKAHLREGWRAGRLELQD